MGVILAIAGVLLSFLNPVASVMLFVLLAPFGVINKFTGIDPRTYWALALAVRAGFDQFAHRNRVPFSAQLTWIVFAALTAAVIWTRGSDLDAETLVNVQSVFQYFVSASFAAFAVIQLCHTANDQRRLAKAFAVSVLWVGVVSIVQAISIWRAGSVERVIGPQGNPNYLAAFLGTSATVLLLLQARGLIERRTSYPVIAVAWTGCVITVSRTGLLAATLGLLLHWACTSSNRHRIRRSIAVGVTTLIVLMTLAFYGSQLRARFVGGSGNSQQEKAAQLGQAVSDLGRLEAGLYALKLIQENPVLGSGFATFTARNYNENGVYLTTHDTYLQLLTGTGIAGALLVGLLFYQLLRVIPPSLRLLLLPTTGCLLVNAGFGDYMHAIDIFVVVAIAYLSVSRLWVEAPA